MAERVKEIKNFGVGVWLPSSYFILQKLLNDKKIHGKSIVSSEIKEQDCQEPVNIKEEEYKKLQDILQQRENEISILSKVIQNSSSTGLEGGVGTLDVIPQPHPTFLPVHIASSYLEGCFPSANKM